MSGYVYFLRPVGQLGPVKVGYSALPEVRLQQMMLWSPVDLEIWATSPGTQTDEYNVHCALAGSFYRHEWFHHSETMQAIVERINAGEGIGEIVPGKCGPHPLHNAALNKNKRRTPAEREVMSLHTRARHAERKTGYALPEHVTDEYYRWFSQRAGREEAMPKRLAAKFLAFIEDPKTWGAAVASERARKARENYRAA